MIILEWLAALLGLIMRNDRLRDSIAVALWLAVSVLIATEIGLKLR